MNVDLIAGAWMLSTGFFAWKSRANFAAFEELAVGRDVFREDLTVVIPARNEEGKIGRAVRSLATQAKVIVVDDASIDRTADEAREAGANVMAAPALAPGHRGKPNACLAGARAAATPWILFVDADTWYEPGFVNVLTERAEARGLGMASVFLRNDCKTWAERVLLPYAFGLYFCGVDARRVQDTETSDALANGQCLLVRADAYWAIGGHGAVINSVIEDIALAAAMKAPGTAQGIFRAPRIGAVRMYDSLSAIWSGFLKNSYRFVRAQPRTGLQVMAASILLTSYLPLLGWLALDGAWIWAALVLLGPPALLWRWYEEASPRVLSPVAIYLFQLIALHAMALAIFRSRTSWKGRYV